MDMETLCSSKSAGMNVFESIISLLIVIILGILFYVFIYVDSDAIWLIILYVIIIIALFPIIFRDYISRERRIRSLRYSLLSYLSLEQLEKYLENGKIIFSEDSTHPDENLSGYGFIMNLRGLGEINLEIFEVCGKIEIIFEFDLPFIHSPLEWRLTTSSLDEIKLDKVHYTVEFAQKNDIRTYPPKKELSDLFSSFFSNWCRNPLTPKLRVLNADERVEIRLEISKYTSRITFQIDNFNWNYLDLMVKQFFQSVIPVLIEFSNFVQTRYNELNKQWRALLTNKHYLQE